jgi:replicative DNA helicase
MSEALFAPRLPPSNLQAEQALLGALLANNKAYERVSAFLRAEHFADPIHARLFDAIRARVESGRIADAVSLRAEFEHSGVLEEVGGVAYLAQLLYAMVGVINAGEYGRVIYDAWLRRQMIELAQEMHARAFGEAAEALDATDVLSWLDERVTRLAQNAGSDAPLVGAASAAQAALAMCERAAKARGGLTGITTGYHALDRMTGGWRGGDLVLIGARPSMGKTALAAGMAARAAASGARVLFVSAEMSAAQIGARLVAAAARLPVISVLRGAIIDPGSQSLRQLTGDEGAALVEARDAIGALPIVFQDRGPFTLSAIRQKARALARDAKAGGLGLIVVDYVGLLRGSEIAQRNGKYAEVSEISQGLKALARELDVPVIALSQLSREVEKREDRTPMLSDLRDSGTLEQDADLVGFLYRAHYYLSRNPPQRREKDRDGAFEQRVEQWHEAVAREAGRGDLFVAKHRQGPTGKVALRWAERITWFFDEDEPAEARAF